MNSSARPADPSIDSGALAIRCLYAKYLAEARITFDELLIIAQLTDCSEHEVTEMAIRLNLDAHQINSGIENLERERYIERLYPSPSRPMRIRLVADLRPVAKRLLVVQANVDLDLGAVSEEVNHLRRSLLSLARRSSTRRPESR